MPSASHAVFNSHKQFSQGLTFCPTDEEAEEQVKKFMQGSDTQTRLITLLLILEQMYFRSTGLGIDQTLPHFRKKTGNLKF